MIFRLSKRVVAIAVGGVLGAAVRWAVLLNWPPTDGFVWPVFTVNVIGSFIVGIAMGEQWKHPHARTLLHDGLAIGFCGGLTTFSTLAVETASLLDSQHWATGLIYLFGSLSIAIASAVAGAALVRRMNALRLSLEGER